MSQKDIFSPVATVDTNQCTVIPPWFVEGTEYPPALATYKPLVNGEEAFRAVHEAIANAKKTVDIICWGFQPSMYFIRDGQAPCIGELLDRITRKNKVQVRILGWEMPFNTAGFAGEANLPAKGAFHWDARAGQSSTDEQYAYDSQWFADHSYIGNWSDVLLGVSGLEGQAFQAQSRQNKLLLTSPLFVSRGFDKSERTEIYYREKLNSAARISKTTIAALAATTTHHQKTVLVDYELPEYAVGFVMGHNMLDEYWDTDAHTSKNRENNQLAPNAGPRGHLPRQDMSSRVTGPILEYLHENFATAWKKETDQDLIALRHAKKVAKQLKPRVGYDTPLLAQLLRTQSQDGRTDIKKLYLQTINNATQFIYIENQYFRWPPLAETIKKAAKAQTKGGRDPGKHGALYLFVVSNVTDDGIGAGTLNTQRMLESLGRADTIPAITKKLKIDELRNETFGKSEKYEYFDPRDPAPANQEKLANLRKFTKKSQEIKGMVPALLANNDIPGLKTHICSLVAPDSPAEEWMPVYIHSKIMLINDVFTTHGSANINTRSMETDSEMNIAHDWADVTKALRQRLWKSHTNGLGAQDDPAEAFTTWGDILARNNINQTGKIKKTPEASLIQFLYDKPTIKDQD